MSVEIRDGVRRKDLQSILQQPCGAERASLSHSGMSVAQGIDHALTEIIDAFVLYEGAVPKVAAGLVRYPQNFGFAWLVTAGDLPRYIKPVLKNLRLRTDAAVSKGLRLYAFTDRTRPQDGRFLEHIGFRRCETGSSRCLYLKGI